MGTSRRGELGVSHSTSGIDSDAQHQYYMHHNHYLGNGKHPLPSPMRRDPPPGQGGQGGRGVPIIKSVSATSTYPGRGPGTVSGGDFSLGQYSPDGSETSSGRYSECSSQYDHHHSWRHGKNLQYVNESYGEHSAED